MSYLGVPESVLSYTTQDYLVRSADALFRPLLALAALALITVWGYRILRGLTSEKTWDRIVRLLIPAAILTGMTLLAVAAHGALRIDPYSAHPYVPGVCLATGVVLLDAGLRAIPRISDSDETKPTTRPAPARVISWGATFVLVSIGLFWATQTYAAAVGTARAQAIEAKLTTWPDAVLYSAKRLNLGAPGVYETECQDPQAAYRYRYDGLKLIIQSGDNYLFLPETWTYNDGVALIVRQDTGLRLEFAVLPQTPDRAC
ncbi:MAG: hypothetical protein WCG47_26125 [Dermatophilaceae bacterium]